MSNRLTEYPGITGLFQIRKLLLVKQHFGDVWSTELWHRAINME